MPNNSQFVIRNWPLWWFSVLESAIQRGDFVTAAKAQRHLARLGVRVDYGRPHGQRHTGGRTDARGLR
jgi:hypothetical protein